jgi:5,10-methylenetetrahydrofolate reductase
VHPDGRSKSRPLQGVVSSYLALLRTSETPVVTVELRPPRAELRADEGIDAWIDTYHAITSLARQNVHVMITDSAVGAQEENNLRHLVTNLGPELARSHVVPFLTSKHSVDFCLGYADQAVHHRFPSLVILGGDQHVGRPRCVAHAWELRQMIRRRHPDLELGGWANPMASAATQVDFLLDSHANADFYLTQIVSHHQTAQIAAFMDERRRRHLEMPGVFGVFYYRSANPATLEMLRQFLPVPVEELTAEFESGATPVEVCARTIRTLLELGARHFYVSNLPLRRTAQALTAILDQAGLHSVPAGRELRTKN